ncbi:MAG: threonine-phosphate decarboxylase [Clostridia bacterium]|jgi:threonine-phosphate decarboxylase|nr:threonine-phosphate decarboxylase [Clostridia bacterium]
MVQIRKHGGNLKEASEKYKIPVEKFIDFSANINPLGPPEGVFEVIKDNLEKITQYPDSRNLEIKKALAYYLNVDINSLILGNGASELIFLIVNNLRPKTAWLPVPTFSEYEIASRAAGANIIQVPLQGEKFNKFTIDQLEGLAKGDILFICNPNNPTGQLYDVKLLNHILQATNDTEAYLVIDESFLDFIKERKEVSFIEKIKEYPRLIILYSLTKFFAIPGLRLGAMIANPKLIEQFELGRDPWNVNIFAQLAGKVALEDKEFIEKTLDYFENEKKFFYTELQQIKGLIPYEPKANYIFIKLLEPNNSSEVCDLLARDGFLVRNLNTYPLLGENYIRVAIKTRKENLMLIHSLKKCIRGI